MPKYKLTYFNARGRAEISRILLSYGKADWEDNRIQKEKWMEYKPKMPLGSLPCLEVDGKLINNSGAIQRYLAQEFGVFGDDAITRAQIDVLGDYMMTPFGSFDKILTEKDDAKKKELFKTFFCDIVEPILKNVEKILTANGKKFLVGKSMTLADIIAYHIFWQLSAMSAGCLDNHPLMKVHVESIGNDPKIKAWVDKRPKTDW